MKVDANGRHHDEDGLFTSETGGGEKSPKDMSIAELEERQVKEVPGQQYTTVDAQLEVDERDFAEQVDAVANGTFQNESSHIQMLSHTPNVFVEAIGMPDLPILMSYKKLYTSMTSDARFSDHPHDMGAEVVKQIPRALQDPEYIVEGTKPKRVDALLSIKDLKGRPVYVVIEIGSVGRVKGDHTNANVLVTAFGAQSGYVRGMLKRKILYKKTRT